MKKISPEVVLESLNWRYATKKFDVDKKISPEDWYALEETLRMSPSSMGLQPWKFIVAQSPEIREKLAGASGNRNQILTCSHLVIVTRLKTISPEYIHRYFAEVSRVRVFSPENIKQMEDKTFAGFTREPMASTLPHWTARQAYLAMGMFMSAAALLGVDVCPMEGFNIKAFDDILDLTTSEYGTVAVMATGYRAFDDEFQKEAKVRFPREDVIRFI